MTDHERANPDVPDPAADTTTTPTPTPVSPTTPATPTGSAPIAPPPVSAATTSVAPGADTATIDEVAPSSVQLTPVATAPADQAQTGRRGGRGRWAIAGGVVAVVALLTGAVAFALTGASPNATVLGYVPADSVVYGEARLDLPGDQRRAVGEFLSKFPGFADQAALDTKLDEVLDQFVSEATEGEQTFTADIKPWFDGEVAFSMSELPSDLGAASDGDKRGPGGLALISIKDEALARAWFAETIADTGATPTTQDYKGTELTVFADTGRTDMEAAFAIIGGKVAVAGDLASVRAAIDTNGTGGLADDADFSKAMAAADGDHIGFVYVELGSIVESVMSLGASVGGGVDLPGAETLAGLVPDWASFRLRVEGDALVMDSAVPHVEGAVGPDTNRANAVASWAPPSTIALAAGNDYGQTLLSMVEQYRDDPNLGEVFKQIDEAVGVLGGLESAVGWMGDAGIVVADPVEGIEGGIVIVPTDAAAGQRLMTTLGSFATLGGAQAGITVRTEEHNGTTITVVDLGDIGALAGMTEAFGGPAELPFDPGALPEGHVEIAYAATDDVVVIGSGPDFVKRVLDAGAGQSLADESRYQSLVGRVGAEHTGVTFVDIAAIRGLIEELLPMAGAEQQAKYEESIKPFLTPFDAFVAATVRAGELDEQHGIITVK